MKKALLLIPLLLLSACTQELSKTPEQWCVDEVKQEFAFDFEGQSGIFFVREADDYLVQDETEEAPLIYVYLVDVVHDGANDFVVIAEYFAWVEFNERNPVQEWFATRTQYDESEIIDIGAELIERDNGETSLGIPL